MLLTAEGMIISTIVTLFLSLTVSDLWRCQEMYTSMYLPYYSEKSKYEDKTKRAIY